MFLLTQLVDLVAWTYIAAYDKRALIRVGDQPSQIHDTIIKVRTFFEGKNFGKAC